MRPLEQMTMEEITRSATLADIALYGGLIAIGALAGIFLILKYGGRK